jgi:cytochrome c biogenesis protein CcdA
MLVLLALVVSIGIVDSLNPSTVGPAVLLALGTRAKRDLALFTLAVFGTSTLGGLVLVFGPGRALLAVASTPRPHVVHLVEVAAGALLLAGAVVLLLARGALSRRFSADAKRARVSPLLLGAGIIVAEFPTAFPYFGALVAIIEGRRAALSEAALVIVFNLCFCAPLLVLLTVVVLGGDRDRAFTRAVRAFMERYAAVLVPAVLALLGATLLAIGLSSL